MGQPVKLSARSSVLICFFVAGMTLGSWFPRIPDVQRALQLSHGALGLALIGTAVGALAGMPLTNWLISRFGSRRIVTVAGLWLCLALPLPAVAPNLGLLFVSLFLLGVGNGVLDVSMNVQAVMVEAAGKRPMMATFHALFSVGGLAGAAGAGLVAIIQMPATTHLLIVGLAMSVAILVASRFLLPQSAADRTGPSFARPSRALLGLGVLAFIALIGEGAMADWSAVYLRNTLGASAAAGAIGYGAFTAAMVAGRFGGDWATARLRPERLIRLGGWLVGGGLGLGLLLNTPSSVTLGFAAVGLGLAAAFPVLLSVAGNMTPGSPGVAVASVAMMGYTGFLVGPPLIGFVAQVAGLRAGLGMVVLLGAGMILLARFTRIAPRPADFAR